MTLLLCCVQLSWLGSVFRDRPWLLMKHMWFRAGTADMEKDAASRAAEQVSTLVTKMTCYGIADNTNTAQCLFGNG